MLARRVIAISPDKALAKRLSLGLKAAGGTVETYPGLDALAKGDIQAALVVVHLDGDLADALPEVSDRLRDDAKIICVVPKSRLAEIVAAMQVSPLLAGTLVAEGLTTVEVSAMATRVMRGDIFGLEKVVPWGTRIYSALVGDYQEKSICISQISEFAATMGVRRKYREAIEQCLDEMLMNALYDAPVDSDGKQIFADVPTKTRISLRMEQKAVVQYACDGTRFTVSVRDSYGTLDRDTVLRYLHKCLHSEQQIDRKTGGAGLGLYIMANASSTFLFNVLPGVATECVCSFDVTVPKVQLTHFGFFRERIDASGRLVGGASKLLPSGAAHPVERRATPPPAASRGVVFALGSAIVLLLALIALVAYPRFAGVPTSSVRVNTDPPDAIVEVDGKTRGTAVQGSLIVDDLEVGRAYRVVARRDGYNSAETIVEPVEDETAAVTMLLMPKTAVVSLDTDPDGVTVLHDGRELGTTPLSIDDLLPRSTVELTFQKTGYRTATREVRVPAPGSEAFVSLSLDIANEFGSIAIESDPSGAQVYVNGQLIPGRTPIPEYLIESGRRHRISLKKPGFQPHNQVVKLDEGERGVVVEGELEPGGGLTVRANLEDGRATVVGVRRCRRRPLPLIDCPLPNGTYQLRIDGARPYIRKTLRVVIADNDVTHDLSFGFVRAGPGHRLLIDGHQATKAAFSEGTRTVTVIDAETEEPQEISVRVQADRTITIP